MSTFLDVDLKIEVFWSGPCETPLKNYEVNHTSVNTKEPLWGLEKVLDDDLRYMTSPLIYLWRTILIYQEVLNRLIVRRSDSHNRTS